jgi:hypothetical protein
LAIAAQNRSADEPVPKRLRNSSHKGCPGWHWGVPRSHPKTLCGPEAPQRSIDTGRWANLERQTTRHRRSGYGILRCRTAPSQSDPAWAALAPIQLGPSAAGMCPRTQICPVEESCHAERAVGRFVQSPFARAGWRSTSSPASSRVTHSRRLGIHDRLRTDMRRRWCPFGGQRNCPNCPETVQRRSRLSLQLALEAMAP